NPCASELTRWRPAEYPEYPQLHGVSKMGRPLGHGKIFRHRQDLPGGAAYRTILATGSPRATRPIFSATSRARPCMVPSVHPDTLWLIAYLAMTKAPACRASSWPMRP